MIQICLFKKKKHNKVKNHHRPLRLGSSSHPKSLMVPELVFSVQRQWFPKKSDRNVVCHSPKLKLRKFPFLAPLSLRWKWCTENENLEIHARVRLPLCYLLRDFCVVVLLSFNYEQGLSEQDEEPDGQRPPPPRPLKYVSVVMWFLEGPCSLNFPNELCTGMSQPEMTKTGCFQEFKRNLAATAFYSRIPLLYMASYRRWVLLNVYYFFKCIPKHEKIHHLRMSFSSET